MAYLQDLQQKHFENYILKDGSIDAYLALHDIDCRLGEIAEMLAMIELMLDDDSKNAEDMRSAAIKATIALISMVKSPYAVIFEEIKKLSAVKAPPVELKSVPQETANKVAQAQSHVMQVATAISSIAKLADADESELSFQIAMLSELAKVENRRADEKLSEAEALLHSRDENGGKAAS